MQHFKVLAVKSPDLDEVEVRRRLARAYAIILQAARRPLTQSTADRGEFGDLTRTAAWDAPAVKPEAHDAL